MKSLKRFDRDLYKSKPDQMVLRLNEMVQAITTTNVRNSDTNSWKIFDYGEWKEYEYVIPYNVNVTNGQRTALATIPLPNGVSPGEFSVSVGGFGNFAGHAVYGVDPSGDQLIAYIGNQYSGGPLNFTGQAFVRLREL